MNLTKYAEAAGVDQQPLSAENASDSKPSKNELCIPKRIRNRKPFDEAISPNAQRVYDIRSTDIIFGRGRGYQDHPGNRHMRALLHHYKEQYKILDRPRKRNLVEAVYLFMTQNGARFLHKLENEDTFVIVDIPIALQKVRNTLCCKKRLGRDCGDDDDVVLSTAASTSERRKGCPIDSNKSESSLHAGAGVVGDPATLRHSLERIRVGTAPSHVGLAPPFVLRHTIALQREFMTRQLLGANSIVGNDLLSRAAYAGMAYPHGIVLPRLTDFSEWGFLAGRSLDVPPTQLGSTPLLPRADNRAISHSLLQERQAQLGGISTSASHSKISGDRGTELESFTWM